MYDKGRPAIPAALKRDVLVRAGHGCEISHCLEKTYIEIHHIDGNRENNIINNLIVLCSQHHRMAHEEKIDRKSLKAYINKEQFTVVKADEVERIHKFLDAVNLCLTEYGNGYPEPVGNQLYYFFTKSVYEEMYDFINSGKYQRELRSFDRSVVTIQDRVFNLITEIVQSVTRDKYLDIGLSYKLAGNHSYGPQRDRLIESQDEYVNSRLDEIILLYDELQKYCDIR